MSDVNDSSDNSIDIGDPSDSTAQYQLTDDQSTTPAGNSPGGGDSPPSGQPATITMPPPANGTDYTADDIKKIVAAQGGVGMTKEQVAYVRNYNPTGDQAAAQVSNPLYQATIAAIPQAAGTGGGGSGGATDFGDAANVLATGAGQQVAKAANAASKAAANGLLGALGKLSPTSLAILAGAVWFFFLRKK